MKDPAFLFYPGDWLGGTMGMTFEEKGCYMELLMMQFNLNEFTEAQAKQVLSICFDVAWPTIQKKFETDGIHFWNERLRKEIEKRRNFTESRRLNAKRTILKEDMGEHMQEHMNEHMQEHMENENRNRNNNVIEVKKRGSGGKDFIASVVQTFVEAYGEARDMEYHVTNMGKERAAAGKLVKIMKEMHPEMDSGETLTSLRAYFDRCMLITDPWLNYNMSLSLINSKFNEINTILKNGNQRTNSKGGATDRELAQLLAAKLGK